MLKGELFVKLHDISPELSRYEFFDFSVGRFQIMRFVCLADTRLNKEFAPNHIPEGVIIFQVRFNVHKVLKPLISQVRRVREANEQKQKEKQRFFHNHWSSRIITIFYYLRKLY